MPRILALAICGFGLCRLPAHAADNVSFEPQPRIVNGVITSLYPNTGSLLVGTDPVDATDRFTECSAVLVGCQTVLTAAHCVCPSGADTGSACLAAGLSDPSTLTVFLQHAGFFQVATVSINPAYDFTVQSDMAMLHLATPVTGIAPSPINTTQSPSPGTTATIVGFGISADDTTDAGVKRTGKVVTQSCIAPISNRTHVCWDFVRPLGPPGTSSNTCNGDSGGPLFINFGAGDVVAGLTSGGEPQCGPNSVSFDDNVFNDRDWVHAEGGDDLNHVTCGALPQVGNPGTVVTTASGQVSATQQEGRLSFEVPPGTQQLRVTLNGADAQGQGTFNDFDLYIKAGHPPTTSDYDCRDIGAAPYGFCGINAPAAGTWYALVEWFAGAGTYQVTATTFAAVCVGDCNGDRRVGIAEIVDGVNIALGSSPVTSCGALDADGNGMVTVDELVHAVNNALTGCPGG